MQRRDFLGAVGAVSAGGLAGCSSVLGSNAPAQTDSETPAHTVSVYLGDRDLTRDVTVIISSVDGSTLFENEYSLSDTTEAVEDATFPASDEPNSVIVAVDLTRFNFDWPGFEHPELPCDAPNHAGIELWIDEKEDGSPEVRLEVNCQSAGMDGRPL